MKPQQQFKLATLTLLAIATLSTAQAADKKKSAPPKAQPEEAPAESVVVDSGAERINVESIKEKYWARGEQSELGVVQNRTYSKEGKWDLGVFGGFVFSDPFLDVKSAGFSLGYHFSEYFEVRGLYFKDFASASGALNTFEQRQTELNGSSNGGTTNYNKPRYYYGGEAVGSFLYGKLSLVGKSIIYYDFYGMAGLGSTATESGSNLTEHVGVGQRYFLNKTLSLSLEYRLMHYKEQLVERVITSKIGQSVGDRDNWTNTITFGVNVLFGGPSETKKNGDSK